MSVDNCFRERDIGKTSPRVSLGEIENVCLTAAVAAAAGDGTAGSSSDQAPPLTSPSWDAVAEVLGAIKAAHFTVWRMERARAQVFRAWRCLAAFGAHLRRCECMDVKASVLAAWRARAARLREARGIAETLGGLRQRLRVEGTLLEWRDLCRARAAERALVAQFALRARARTLRRALSGWRGLADDLGTRRRVAEALGRRGCGRETVPQLRAAFDAWRGEIGRQRRVQLLLDSMLQSHYGRIARGAFQAWREAARWRACVRHRVRTVAMRRRLGLLRGAFDAWAMAAGEQRRKREAVARNVAMRRVALECFAGHLWPAVQAEVVAAVAARLAEAGPGLRGPRSQPGSAEKAASRGPVASLNAGAPSPRCHAPSRPAWAAPTPVRERSTAARPAPGDGDGCSHLSSPAPTAPGGRALGGVPAAADEGLSGARPHAVPDLTVRVSGSEDRDCWPAGAWGESWSVMAINPLADHDHCHDHHDVNDSVIPPIATPERASIPPVDPGNAPRAPPSPLPGAGGLPLRVRASNIPRPPPGVSGNKGPSQAGASVWHSGFAGETRVTEMQSVANRD